MSPELRAAVAADWLTDLREFAAPLVAEAVARYRQGPDHRKRPMSGDIRHLCIELQREARERAPKPLMIADQRAMRDAHENLSRRFREAHEARQRFAREAGEDDFAAVMTGPGIVAAGKRIKG